MNSVYKENSAWVEWLPTAAGLAYTDRYDLTQVGPRERKIADAEMRDCREAEPNDYDKLVKNAGISSNPHTPCWWDVQIFGWTLETNISAAGVPSTLDPRALGNRNVPLRGILTYLGDEVEFDVGSGCHFSVYAPSLGISVRAPTGSFAVGNQGQSNFIGTPMAPVIVTSSLVYGQIGGVCETHRDYDRYAHRHASHYGGNEHRCSTPSANTSDRPKHGKPPGHGAQLGVRPTQWLRPWADRLRHSDDSSSHECHASTFDSNHHSDWCSGPNADLHLGPRTMSNDGLTISFPADDTSDQRRTKVASMAEGAVLVNLAELEDGAALSVDELTYEKPRGGGRNQRIGSLRDVNRRGRATCLEIAAICAAAERAAGNNAFVQVISTKYKKKAVPYQYHAIVRYPDGSVFDASELLGGYNAEGEWWQRTGHCCSSCALDEPCQGNCSCKGEH